MSLASISSQKLVCRLRPYSWENSEMATPAVHLDSIHTPSRAFGRGLDFTLKADPFIELNPQHQKVGKEMFC